MGTALSSLGSVASGSMGGFAKGFAAGGSKAAVAGALAGATLGIGSAISNAKNSSNPSKEGRHKGLFERYIQKGYDALKFTLSDAPTLLGATSKIPGMPAHVSSHIKTGENMFRDFLPTAEHVGKVVADVAKGGTARSSVISNLGASAGFHQVMAERVARLLANKASSHLGIHPRTAAVLGDPVARQMVARAGKSSVNYHTVNRIAEMHSLPLAIFGHGGAGIRHQPVGQMAPSAFSEENDASHAIVSV